VEGHACRAEEPIPMSDSFIPNRPQIPDWITEGLHREIEGRLAERTPDPQGLLRALDRACQPRLEQPYLRQLYERMRPKIVQSAASSLANSCVIVPEELEFTVYSDYDEAKHMGPRSILRDHLLASYTLQAGRHFIRGRFRFDWDTSAPGEVAAHGVLLLPDWSCDIAEYVCETCTTPRWIGCWQGAAPKVVQCLVCANNLRHSGSTQAIPVTVEMLRGDPEKYNALHVHIAGWMEHEFEFCALYAQENDGVDPRTDWLDHEESLEIQEPEFIRTVLGPSQSLPYFSGWVRLRAVFGAPWPTTEHAYGSIPDQAHLGPGGARLKRIKRGICPWIQQIRPDGTNIWKMQGSKRPLSSALGPTGFEFHYVLSLIEWTRTYGKPPELGWR
jgi:hypothetical protein